MSAHDRRVVLAPDALQDLRAIRLYGLRQWGAERTNAYRQELDNGFQILQRHPFIGVARDELLTGLRLFPIENHVIYYRVTPDSVEILRILHKRAEASRIFSRER